jgi:hypothetical protein
LRKPAEVLRGLCFGRGHRHIDEIRDRIDTVLRHLRDDRIGDAIFVVQPEIWLHLLTAGQSDQQAVGDIPLRQSDLPG